MKISDFVRTHYRHFNAAALADATDAYRVHLAGGGKMMLAMAGAMSTAELGLSLAEMIRQVMFTAMSGVPAQSGLVWMRGRRLWSCRSSDRYSIFSGPIGGRFNF